MKKIIIFLILIVLIIGSLVFLYFNNNSSKNETETTSENMENVTSLQNDENKYKSSNITYQINDNILLSDYKTINRFYYRVIKDYQTYLDTKDNFNNILEVSEKDFENNFMVLVITENAPVNGLIFDNLSADDSSLTLNYVVNSSDRDAQTGTSILVSNDLYRDTINIEKTVPEMKMTSYTNIRELPKDYSVEDAKKDNCLVIDMKNNANYNLNNLEDFIEKVKNKENAEIRIYNYMGNDQIYIYDITYSNENKFFVCEDRTRYTSNKNNNSTYESYQINTDTITVAPSSISTTTLYTIEDEYESLSFGITK